MRRESFSVIRNRKGSMWNSDVVDEESEDDDSSSSTTNDEDDEKQQCKRDERRQPIEAVNKPVEPSAAKLSIRRGGSNTPTVGIGLTADEEIEDMLEVWKRKRTLKSER